MRLLSPSAIDGNDRAQRALERRREREGDRVESMRSYAETTGCRRQLILGYFRGLTR